MNEAYENLREAARLAFPTDGSESDRSMLETIVDTGLRPTVPTDYERWRPLHWAIEVPDVVVDRGGFDAVVGNPPFLGDHKLSNAIGATSDCGSPTQWLITQLARQTWSHTLPPCFHDDNGCRKPRSHCDK